MVTIVEIEIPGKVLNILKALNGEGFEAFVVGGCVRDALLGKKPGDWDITTSALPGDVKRIFRRTVDTGIKHGTVTVMLGKEGFEVTTYRIDGDYNDSRHPKDVTFTSNLAEDLSRRDFTINAMAYHPDRGLVDEFDGIKDLEEKIIRCVRDPVERFTEDALRILRAVRFAAQLDFTIEDNTKNAISELCESLNKISAERIRTELDKLITSDNPQRFMDAYRLGITRVVLPEFDRMALTPQNNPHHCYNVGEHCIKSLEFLKEDTKGCVNEKMRSRLSWVMLLHDVGKPDTRTTDKKGIDHFNGHNEAGRDITENILKRLKFDNESVSFICKMVYYHDYRYKYEISLKSIRKTASKIGAQNMGCTFFIQRADIMAQSSFKREEKLKLLDEIKEMYERIEREGHCVSKKDLKVTGKDLIEAGFSPGPGMGQILDALFEFVLEDEKNNDREILMRKAIELNSKE